MGKKHIGAFFLLIAGCASALNMGWATETSEAVEAPVTSLEWTVTDYDNFDFNSFEQLPRANQRIDMENINYALLHAAIFYESNRQREEQGVQQFSHSPALERAAKGHSDDMTANNFFAHKSPVSGRETSAKRLAIAGASGGASAENIALSFGIEYEANRPVATPAQNGGYFSYSFGGEPIQNHTYIGLAKAVVKQWMESPGHRVNLLNPTYIFLGTGSSHYTDAKFHGIDKFKSTQNFSSIKGD